ncbi:MAG: hypothetical protein JO171_17730 [Paludibacterium sp.]|uniref:hypothetical protein n=1 Tax=Paludibacterium sp. TaxID=1917523 RepID=UPI0025CD86E4|nr:hypothetical protein [Paludibacterium sp.]MBV8048994.1 hypothetical protein [Paludibacterium sp.]MBV8647489.1 hypothetical protein [Paludibacterium sp.]
MHYQFGVPRLEALPLRLGQRLRLPSGRSAVVEALARHDIALRYADNGAALVLDRALLARLLAGAAQPRKGDSLGRFIGCAFVSGDAGQYGAVPERQWSAELDRRRHQNL